MRYIRSQLRNGEGFLIRSASTNPTPAAWVFIIWKNNGVWRAASGGGIGPIFQVGVWADIPFGMGRMQYNEMGRENRVSFKVNLADGYNLNFIKMSHRGAENAEMRCKTNGEAQDKTSAG